MSTIQLFIERVKKEPTSIAFPETIQIIDENYTFTPSSFKNGKLLNEVDQNNGSCKLFAFARLIGLSENETLACFGDFYRKDVLQNPDGTDHQNIRNFMEFGWNGIEFFDRPLQLKD